MGNYADLPPEQRPGYMNQNPHGSSPNITYAQSGNVQYAPTPQNFSYTSAPSSHVGPTRTPSAPSGGYNYANTANKITYTAKPVGAATQPPIVRHTSQPSGAYPTPPQPQYTAMPHAPPPPPMESYAPRPDDHYHAPPPPPSGSTSTHDGRKIVEMVPGGGGKLNAPPSPGMRPHSLSVSGNRPDGLNSRMDRLSVSGNRPDIQTIVPGGMGSGGLPPPSPLLEAYHGTYQSISPMPQAMMLDDDLDDDLDHLPPLDSYDSRPHGGGHQRAHSSSRRPTSPPGRSKHKDKLAMDAYGGGGHGGGGHGGGGQLQPYRKEEKEKEKRRARIYDATDDALALVDALAAKTPDADTITDVLTALSHDQILELRAEYKRHCKVQGRGINIAKHIKLKTSGNFGKIAYVTALGKYEGEGYWANYWYQSNSARRELLIEALMGRQNYEIREIKDAFKDKRYSDSLTRCMDKELKADKFRKAVLMALEGERQEESDAWPPEYRNRDVDTLYKAIKAREGGESAMLGVVVMRSDAHLREVLRTYERKYQASFARDALRKSNNLVGEVIAHILNGVINRPARDAMLLHHALTDLIEPPSHDPNSRSSATSKHERQQRFELLISRLVRLHWDRMHLSRVKNEYEEKYGRVVEEDIEEATRGDFREFCIAICQIS
ncbi:hypothetical protein BKA63DRAFT_563936 [Paraphoma chrysanthemicola]|nr:hypothetical protein BKA63DRAFT_563936 [Paraphoma chrysanthemicola]